jgi:hypothetical protein
VQHPPVAEVVFPGQERGVDWLGGAVGERVPVLVAAVERVDPHRGEQLDRGVQVAAERQGPQREEHQPGVRPGRQVPVGHCAVPAGWQDQVPAPFAAVGAGQPHVGDPPLVMVIGQADDRAGRELDHHRAGLAQVEEAARVRGVGVQREPHVPGLRDHEQCRLAVGRPRGTCPAGDRLHRHRRVEEVIRLEGPPQVLLAVRRVGTQRDGEVVFELDRARHTRIQLRPPHGLLHPGSVN